MNSLNIINYLLLEWMENVYILCWIMLGHIGLIDYDEVEESNLHRQLLHAEDSVGHSKVDSAAVSLKR